MKRITMTKEEFIKKVDTGVETNRKLNNDYTQIEMFDTTNRIEFYDRCIDHPQLHLMYNMDFYPNWDKAFIEEHPYAGIVKYKMQKRKMVKFTVNISLGRMDLYDTLSLAGIEQDKIEDSFFLRRAMDIKRVLQLCNWEKYSAWNHNGKPIKLNEKDRSFIYDCIQKDWVCFQLSTREFIPAKDAITFKPLG